MSGMTPKQILALELDRVQQDRQIREHRLSHLYWECTMRCNLDCRHCGTTCQRLDNLGDMPLRDFLAVLDNIAQSEDPHDVFVTLTGGEPFTRTDLAVCGREIYRRGYAWGVVTNGLAFDEQLFHTLVDNGLQSITISLDGLEHEHNWLRANPDSFACASEAIRVAAHERRVETIVVTHVNQRNIDYLPQLADYLRSLGATEWQLQTLFPAGRAKNDKELLLEDYQMENLMEFIKSQRETNANAAEGTLAMHVSYGCEGFLGQYEGKVRDGFYSCQAGISKGCVRTNGDIGGCPTISYKYSQGNIYEGDEFMDVWNTCFDPYRKRDWLHKGICTHCKVFRYCRAGSMHLRDDEGTLLQCNYFCLNRR